VSPQDVDCICGIVELRELELCCPCGVRFQTEEPFAGLLFGLDPLEPLLAIDADGGNEPAGLVAVNVAGVFYRRDS
jgi:hypothetical protein